MVQLAGPARGIGGHIFREMDAYFGGRLTTGASNLIGS
jgi:hypothetical protein